GEIPTRRMPTEARTPPVYTAIATSSKPGAVIEFPVEWNQQQRVPVYYANTYRRPTVNGMSGWGMYYFNASEPESWERMSSTTPETVGLDALRAEHIAGLRFVVMHTDEIQSYILPSYVSGISILGGQFVAAFDDDYLYELPDPPPSRPPRAEDIAVQFGTMDWRERFDREVFVNLTFVNRTAENLYAPDTLQHFDITAADGERIIGRGSGYLGPPLFTPHGNFRVRWRMKLTDDSLPRVAAVSVKDDQGVVWATAQMTLPDEP
ncbi:MAG: hypothetical protein ABI461_02245, partial [Polyangiaceae bacterium]